MRAGGVLRFGVGQRFDFLHEDGRLVTFGTLDDPMGEQEGFAGDDEAQALEGVLADKQVGDAGFVFQRDEAMALGGPRALAADRHAGDAHRHAVRQDVEVAGAEDSLRAMPLAPQSHRVRAGARALGLEIRAEPLTQRHGRQHGGGIRNRDEVVVERQLHLPQRLAAVDDFLEIVQDPGLGEQALLPGRGFHPQKEILQREERLAGPLGDEPADGVS